MDEGWSPPTGLFWHLRRHQGTDILPGSREQIQPTNRGRDHGVFAARLVGAGDEPVDDRVHEGKDGGRRVEQRKVELLAETSHVVRQRHDLDDHGLDSAPNRMAVGMVQVGKSPSLSLISTKSTTATAQDDVPR